MARQTFTQGQQVKVKSGWHRWDTAVVIAPDVTTQERRYPAAGGITMATMHHVTVWEVRGDMGEYDRRINGGVVASFRAETYRNTRAQILAMEEYEATIGAERARKAANHKEAEERWERLTTEGYELLALRIYGQCKAECPVAAITDLLRRYLPRPVAVDIAQEGSA